MGNVRLRAVRLFKHPQPTTVIPAKAGIHIPEPSGSRRTGRAYGSPPLASPKFILSNAAGGVEGRE